MGDLDFRLGNIFQDDNDDNEVLENEVVTVDNSYFNRICININSMNNSSINFGNNHRTGPSSVASPVSSPSTPGTTPTPNPGPIPRPTPPRSRNKAQRKNRKKRIPSNATVTVRFPGMIQKKRDPR